jgi:hypothetical protein
VKTGLTGRTILLPSDAVAAYENFTAIAYSNPRPTFAFQHALTPFSAAEIGFEFSNEFLSARHESFLQGNHAVLPAFDRAWKAKLRSNRA